MFYSISYFHKDDTFAYVDRATYQQVDKALVRATLHCAQFNTDTPSAKIIYQGKAVRKVVRAIVVENSEPKYQ